MSLDSFRFPSEASLSPREMESISESSSFFLHSLLSPNDQVKIQALKKLRKITAHEPNRVLLVNSDSGLISALVEAISASVDECTELILRVLLDLSSQPTTRRDLVLLNPYIFRHLLHVLRGEDPVNNIVALEIIKNLSADEQNALALMSPPLGLLPTLFELVHFEPGEARMAALSILVQVVEVVETHRQPPLEVTDMVHFPLYFRTDIEEISDHGFYVILRLSSSPLS